MMVDVPAPMAVRTKWAACCLLAGFIVIILIEWRSGELVGVPLAENNSTNEIWASRTEEYRKKKQLKNEVFDILVDQGVYESTSFENEAGVIPPFWDENSTSICKPDDTTTVELGPCFGAHQRVDWEKQISLNPEPKYTPLMTGTKENMKQKDDWANHCRPGFLIIGAGKCGTSSLYHYLTDHPRVIPASEKQIHYFKYFSSRPMKWYLQHFPTTTSFLSSGALMTGEASPGYLPYPEVAEMVRKRLPGSGVKIIAIGRDPVERAYSSYRYSYVTPTVEAMRGGKVEGIPKKKSDAFYEQYLFSFQQMMEAELKQLKSCLAVPNGSAVKQVFEKYGSHSAWIEEFQRRDEKGLPPLASLGPECYGGQTNDDALREQWVKLKERFPEKVILNKNVHLQQALIGRSLYTIPLEWWYAQFDRSDLYFVCTEELRDLSGDPLNELGQFLGLPSFNFSSIVQKGAYNVGGNRGYDKETSWESYERERQIDKKRLQYPLTDEFRHELDEFIRPYNERLFELIGRRCNW